MSTDCPSENVICDLLAKDYHHQGPEGLSRQGGGPHSSFDFDRLGDNFGGINHSAAKPEDVSDGSHMGQSLFPGLGEWRMDSVSSVTPPMSHSPEDSQESGSSKGHTKPNTQQHNGSERGYAPEETLTEQEILARKKAQNRAAQKAFRERKEAKLKELESKLLSSERDKKALLRELEDLKKLNLEIATENRLLSKTEQRSSPDVRAETVKYHFPSRKHFIEVTSGDHKIDLNEPMPLSSYEHFGQRLLTLPATWEYLHELSKSEDFDVYFVMENLRGNEVCHGYGPAYPQDVIDNIVRNCP
ncbi:LAFA_0F08966g1_1 [Lachancea sp. 'fantastica']|nr:LAFA_0F08966g1_1 [Lachancea sp. 'fantastica']